MVERLVFVVLFVFCLFRDRVARDERLFVVVFKTRSHSSVFPGLEFTMLGKDDLELTEILLPLLNLNFLNAEIKGVCHHTKLHSQSMLTPTNLTVTFLFWLSCSKALPSSVTV